MIKHNERFTGFICVLQRVLQSELSCREKLGKSIVAKRYIPEGTILTINDIAIKVSRPKGIPSEGIDFVIGKVIDTSAKADTPIRHTDLR